MPRLLASASCVVMLVAAPRAAGADEQSGGAPTPPPAAPGAPDAQAEAVDEATTPLPTKTQLAFKPSYTFPNGADRYTAELLFEPVLPYHGFLIPDLEVRGVWSIARLEVFGKSLQNSQGPSSGIGDLTFTDLVATHAGPFDVAGGFATVFPMATTPALGQGKWQLGPAVAGRFDGLSPLKIAALVENFYSVAGNSQSAELAYVTVQPLLTLELPAAFFLSSDATMNFYWKGGKSTVPVDLGLGRAFSEHFVGALQFWYTVAESDQGDIEVRAVLNFEP
jgi:hypothetical protein